MKVITLRFHSTAILPQVFFFLPPVCKKYVGSQKVAEVYRAPKCTRLVSLHCEVSNDFQLTVKQWDWISQQKNVFMLVRSVKENYHGNTFRGQFSCKVACLSRDLSFWELLARSHKCQDDIVMHTHSSFYLFTFLLCSNSTKALHLSLSLSLALTLCRRITPSKIELWWIFSPWGGNLKWYLS